jgi:hypothetical protein
VPAGKQTHREVLFEFHQVGRSVRVSALDTLTGVEVQIVGDPRYTHDALKRVALRKLNYVLEKRSGAAGGGRE